MSPQLPKSFLLTIKDSFSGHTFLIDTGVQVSMTPATALDQASPSVNLEITHLFSANGSHIRIFCTSSSYLCLARGKFHVNFLHADVAYPLLGADFLCQHQLLVDIAYHWSALVASPAYLAHQPHLPHLSVSNLWSLTRIPSLLFLVNFWVCSLLPSLLKTRIMESFTTSPLKSGASQDTSHLKSCGLPRKSLPPWCRWELFNPPGGIGPPPSTSFLKLPVSGTPVAITTDSIFILFLTVIQSHVYKTSLPPWLA